MSKLRREFDSRRALGLVVCLLYLTIALGVNAFHSDDCPFAHGENGPSSDSCPACRFLANAHSPEILPDSLPAIIEHRFDVPPTVTSPSATVRRLASSIVLRGPPSPTQA